MSQIEPMDVDGINNDFDNKENSLRHSNISRTPCMEKGYEELDVSELNMKLRYSNTPATSPLSKSLSSYCLDNRSFNSDDSINSVVISENQNLTRSLNSTITRHDTKRSLKALPLQALSNDQTNENRTTSVLCSLNPKSLDANVTITLSGEIDNEDNISLPSTPSTVTQTPEAVTPTKEVSKHDDSSSPILRGIKSVLNMFRSSQSPVPEPENKSISDTKLLSPIDLKEMVKSETSSILASTPIANKPRVSRDSKSCSPLKDSITFNDDLEKELQWKDDTTILFKEEKIPIHKLFPSHFLPSSSKITDNVMAASVTEQNAKVNTSLEYMDISNNDSVLVNEVATNATSGLQETLTVESDAEFVDCETTVNDDICNNGEDYTLYINKHNNTIQYKQPTRDNITNSPQITMNNSQTTTDSNSLVEDDFAMKNSNLSQLVQQDTEVSKQLPKIIANDCNISDKCVQGDFNSCANDKQKELEYEKNELLGSGDVNYERFHEKQNTHSIIAPIINSNLSKDDFQIDDNLNKDCDQIITPSEVPLPDDNDGENDIILENIGVSMITSINTPESSTNEKQSISDEDQKKLIPTESDSKISKNEMDVSLQEVNSENPIITQQSSYLIHNISSDATDNVLEHQIISSNILFDLNSTDSKQKILDETEVMDTREMVNEISLKNIDGGSHETTDQSELLKVNVSDYAETLITEHSNVISDELVCQDLIKTISPCSQNKCEQVLSTSSNVIETQQNLVNIPGTEEIMTTIINTGENENLNVLSEDLNKVSLNLKNEQDKRRETVISSEYILNVITKELDDLRQNNSSQLAQDKHDITSGENLNRIDIENDSSDNHLISSITVSEVTTEPVSIINEENCVSSNSTLRGKEVQNAVLSKETCEELIYISVKEQTNQIKDETNALDITYTEKPAPDSIYVDNNINKEEIKEDLNIINKSYVRDMNMFSSLSPQNVCASYNLNKNEDTCFRNSELQNIDLPHNMVSKEHPNLNKCLEENIQIANIYTEQNAHVIKALDSTSNAEEDPACPLVNNINQEETKIENLHQSLNTSTKFVSPVRDPNVVSKVHLDAIVDSFAAKPQETQYIDFTEKMAAHVNTEVHDCKEQINSNDNETEGMQNNIKSLETKAEKDILSDLLADKKINTEEKINYLGHDINEESVESPPLSPQISCDGYNFNFEMLEDPFATKARIRMSPPPDDTTALPFIKNNSQISHQLCQNECVEEQNLHPEHENQDNSAIKTNSVLSSLNKRRSKSKSKESTPSKGPTTSNDHVDSLMDINFGKVANDDAINRNVEVNLNKEKVVRVENVVLEEMYKTRREILSNEDENTCFGSKKTDRVADFQTKNVFNLPEMSGVFISNSNAFLSHPFTFENIKAEADVHVFDKRSEDTHDEKVEVKTMQDAAADDVNTEDEDTVEGPFFESEENSPVDKISHQDDMISFADTSSRGIHDDVDNGEMFIDAEAFDFLLNQNKSNVVTDSGKESLFLKFDPLFAKRMSSGGVLNALNEVKRRPTTPKKILRASTFDVTPSGPSNSNKTKDIHNTLEPSFDDPNFTISKPMMVVSPAISACSSQRNKSCTPPRMNRRSLTFTSPAIAAIDRLLSLSGNNSPVNHGSTNSCVRREPNEADLALTQLRELLAEKEIHVQSLRTESKELKNRLCSLELQVKKVESESEQKRRKINELNESLAEKTKVNKSMTAVLEEYERTMASLIAEIEQDKKRHAEERTRLKNERNEQSAHLASMELAFNDLHSKYEKSKQIIMSCKANEETYKKTIAEFHENMLKMQNNYELLKQHATSQLNQANREFDRLKRAHEAEILKLNAMVKRKEVDICSLEETLTQKIKTNEELAAICDDLINKVG